MERRMCEDRGLRKLMNAHGVEMKRDTMQLRSTEVEMIACLESRNLSQLDERFWLTSNNRVDPVDKRIAFTLGTDVTD